MRDHALDWIRTATRGRARRSHERPDEVGGWVARNRPLVELGLWLGVVLALVLDVVLTTHGLQQGFTELNPLARAAFETAGFAALWPMKGLAFLVAVVGWTVLSRRQRVLVPIALGLPWTVAVVSNVGLLATV